MNNKTIYLDEDKIKCLMEAQESVVSPSKAKIECGLSNYPTVNENLEDKEAKHKRSQ
jgi:hypothetical protein